MASFSERYKLVSEKDIQFESVDSKLLNRLWNIFYNREYECEMWTFGGYEIAVPEKLLDFFGCTYDFPSTYIDRNKNIEKLHKVILRSDWYCVYDFVERYVESFENTSQREAIEKEINIVLDQEKSGYRMVKGLITPITNPIELEALDKSLSTPFLTVNTHFEKALKLYSDRKNPDYENSIKESISAVEAFCCIINGKDSTLNKAIDKLKNNGIHIHPAMEKAFVALYGYTSDESGIRHGGIDFANAPSEDAKYMLVSCSAFINYLIEKWSKS